MGKIGKLKNGLRRVEKFAEDHPVAAGTIITAAYLGTNVIATALGKSYSLTPDLPTNPKGIYEVNFNPVLFPVSHLVNKFAEGTGAIAGTVRGYDGNVGRTIVENFKDNLPAYLTPLVVGVEERFAGLGKRAAKHVKSKI